MHDNCQYRKNLQPIRCCDISFLKSNQNRRVPSLRSGFRKNMRIGVLAIQGDYEAHKARLEQLGAEVTLVRKPEQLDAIDGIVIPGGESSTFLNFLAERGFLEKLRDFVSTKPTFGTCAGAILLAAMLRILRSNLLRPWTYEFAATPTAARLIAPSAKPRPNWGRSRWRWCSFVRQRS